MRGVGYKASPKVADTGRMWTKALWGGVPWDQIACGEREGAVFFDDFTNMPALGAVDEDSNFPYACYSDTGSTFGQVADVDYGELALVTDGTDNDEGWISTGGNTGGLCKLIEQGTGVPHTIVFEARVKKSSITIGGMFVGLADPGLAAANTMSDTAAVGHADLADNNFLGFHCPGGDPDAIDVFYQADGQDGVSLITDFHTVVADTYVKVGFRYDYRNSSAKQISFWKNGVINSTYVTKAIIEAATFPGDDDLALLFGGKETSAAAITLTMDWWRFAAVVNA
jgi:hypothetical protein